VLTETEWIKIII